MRILDLEDQITICAMTCNVEALKYRLIHLLKIKLGDKVSTEEINDISARLGKLIDEELRLE